MRRQGQSLRISPSLDGAKRVSGKLRVTNPEIISPLRRNEVSRRRKSADKYALETERILHEAAQLFSEVGAGAASMRLLAERLGVTKPAIYYYFSGKDELLFELHRRVIYSSLADLDQIVSSNKSARDKLLDVINMELMYISEYKAEFTVLLREGHRLPPKYWRDLVSKRAAFLSGIESIVEQGVRTGELRPIDVRLGALALLGMCNWSYTWLQRDGRVPVKDVASVFGSIFLFGVSSLGAKGTRLATRPGR
jgi:AcrR family transcriptional regulator